MKYIRVASDLHLEGFVGRDIDTLMIDFLPHDERDAESALVLAGDISSRPNQLLDFLHLCCERFPKVYFVAGNHEFYRHDYNEYPREVLGGIWNRRDMFGSLRNLEVAINGVSYDELEGGGVRFIFAPLWADGGPSLADQAKVGFYLNDFRLIKNARGNELKYFTVQDMMAEHRAQKADIDRLLRQPFDGKTVVVTHHLPSRRLVSARFWPRDGSDGANGGFVGDCESILAYDHAPDIWIHGHTHDTIDTVLWKTRIVCNPAGYRGEWHTPHNAFWSAENGRPFAVPKFVEL